MIERGMVKKKEKISKIDFKINYRYTRSNEKKKIINKQ